MFWERFYDLCRKRGKFPNTVATELGFSRSTASVWKKRSTPPKREALEKIADYFGVTVSYLLGDSQETSNVGAVFTDQIRLIPVFESVSAGFGAYADDHVIDTVAVMIKSDYEAAETICIRVTGDSMSPVIEDGDLIQVHKVESVDSGDIAVVMLDDESGLVKKVVYGDDWIELVSLNPKYKTRRFEGEDVLRLRVVGKVRRVIRDL